MNTMLRKARKSKIFGNFNLPAFPYARRDGLIEGESTGYTEYKCVQDHKEEYETKPCKCLEVCFYEVTSKVSEGF